MVEHQADKSNICRCGWPLMPLMLGVAKLLVQLCLVFNQLTFISRQKMEDVHLKCSTQGLGTLASFKGQFLYFFDVSEQLALISLNTVICPVYDFGWPVLGGEKDNSLIHGYLIFLVGFVDDFLIRGTPWDSPPRIWSEEFRHPKMLKCMIYIYRTQFCR